MKERNFRKMLEAQWEKGNFVCVGLDSEFDKIPKSARRGSEDRAVSLTNTIASFNKAIVRATKDLVCAYKLNAAFYEMCGDEGIAALNSTIRDIYVIAPDVPIIFDAKRGDIGNTNAGYAQAAFEYFGADAITVHPYLGQEALKPFLERKDKGIIVLCRTSNWGASEFQDLYTFTMNPGAIPSLVSHLGAITSTATDADYLQTVLCKNSMRLYERVASNVASYTWNKNGNCALVVGATYPEELEAVRRIVGDMPILIPGIGAQGGDVEKTVKAGKDSRGKGMIINSSRGIIFASNGPDFAKAARRETMKLRDLINQYR